MKKNFQHIVLYPPLKVIIPVALFMPLFANDANAQGGGLWQASGPTTVITNRIVEINNNAIVDSNLTVNKNFFVPSLINTGFSLARVNNNGRLENFSFTGNTNDVLLGNGTFSNFSSLSGWTLNGNDLYNTNSGKIGIGTNNPQATLHVIGNAIITNGLLTSSLIISEKVQTEKMQGDTVDVTEARAERIGVGVTNPVERLEVGGNAKIDGNLKIGGLSFSTMPAIEVNPCVGLIGIGANGGVVLMNPAADLLFDPNTSPCPEPPIVPFTWQTYGNHVNNDVRWIGTIENFDFRIKTNSELRMTVKKDGKVGIGTANPFSKLHIEDNGNVRITLKDATHPTGRYFQIEQDQDLVSFNDNGIKQIMSMRLTSGNVGIGTTTPQAKMQITVANDNDKAFAVYKGSTEQFLITGDGRFYARAYRIKLGNFPDYVFHKDYQRMLPEEKAKYFEKYNRLPYMPTAKDIESEGLDVGDGLIGITRNVEESALDILDLFKKIEALEIGNKERDNKIKKLEAENEHLKKLTEK